MLFFTPIFEIRTTFLANSVDFQLWPTNISSTWREISKRALVMTNPAKRCLGHKSEVLIWSGLPLPHKLTWFPHELTWFLSEACKLEEQGAHLHPIIVLSIILAAIFFFWMGTQKSNKYYCWLHFRNYRHCWNIGLFIKGRTSIKGNKFLPRSI